MWGRGVVTDRPSAMLTHLQGVSLGKKGAATTLFHYFIILSFYYPTTPFNYTVTPLVYS